MTMSLSLSLFLSRLLIFLYANILLYPLSLRGSMTPKKDLLCLPLFQQFFLWRFVRLDLKSCFEVHLAMYEVGCYWQRSKR
jgi:hypothetical protein